MPAWLVFHASMTSRLETLKVEVFDSKFPVTETISPTLGTATDTEIQMKTSILRQYQRENEKRYVHSLHDVTEAVDLTLT